MSANLFILNRPEFDTTLIEETATKYTLVLQPLYPGYGYTLGNSLRRILLSSIPGYAITKVRINDITHEYQPIDGILEDAMQVVLNIKNLRPMIVTDEESTKMTLKKNKAGKVYASDFNTNSSNAKIINEDAYICTINENIELEIEIEISRGIGYLSVEELKLSENKDARQILLDAVYTPVTNVALSVDKVRLGDNTNMDKLSISFDIDQTVPAIDICKYAFDIMLDLLNNAKDQIKIENLEQKLAKEEAANLAITQSKEEINLPEKIKNILLKNEINTNSQLIKRRAEISEFTGIGVKAMQTVENYIDRLQL